MRETFRDRSGDSGLYDVNPDAGSQNNTKRLMDIDDPSVNAIFDGNEADREGVLIEHLHKLSLKQKVHALLLLSDKEFESFRERRRGGAEFALQLLVAKKNEMGNEECIKAIFELRDANPRYEVEAEIRRRWNGKYPQEWDKELEEDGRFKFGDGLVRMRDGEMIPYEEAVKLTRFEQVRQWYRNSLFPQVTRQENPLTVNIPTIIALFRDFRNNNFNPNRPGTDVSIENLLNVAEYYSEKEFDNPENFRVHKRIFTLAGIIKELEDSISD